ncbi:MAG: TlpA disulfide reductase family protein [Prolixibacteraceae bacterium]|jgi:peroxiredoxin|nr:TlpA disulfide reductase family protein [Prolixibacteraceae bacterium]
MIKNIFLLLAVVFILFASCSKKNEFVIEGRITNATGKYIYLDELKLTVNQTVDSARIDKNGEFSFRGNVSFPTFYLLKLTENNFITLLVDSVENVQVFADAANFSREYVVTGSDGSKLVQELNNHLSVTKHRLDSIRSLTVLYRNHQNYTELKQNWEQEIAQIKKAQINYSADFVQKHPFSMASVLALYQKFDDNNYVVQDLQSLKVAASALNSVFPQSEHVQALYQNTLKLMKDEQNMKLRNIIQQAGTNSPDIILPDPDGKNISLSSLRGKYVLLQFWAAVDKGSRIQNPVLAELYKKYRNRNFEIYQVSIDENRIEWVDAIDQDNLAWINVGDMKGSVSAVNNYNVQKVPFNYLLDPEGKIIARDVQGPALNKLLGEVLK